MGLLPLPKKAMEHLPVEVIGNILSRLGAARDVVIASSTCRKWREAWRNHLHTLAFNSNDWPLYHELTRSRLEIIVTQTIFQTNGLQCLSIVMDDVDEFSAAPVIAWLMYTRETLRELHYNVRTTPNINILEICGRQRLEVLALAHNTITGVEPSYQKFPCLKSLSLSYVSVSALDLSIFLTACPKVEVLSLISLDIVMSDPHASMELSTNSLKDIYVEAISLDKIILEADSLEKLQLKDCTLEVFELVSKGKLRLLKIDDVSVIHLDIGESAENLEIVDVSNFTIMWSKFHHMIAKSSKLRKLRLWAVVFDDDDEVVDIETISACFPQLIHLSLSYELREAAIQYGLQGSFQLENVVVLELGWTLISDLFSQWVVGLLERCPNLRKLVIHGVVSETKTHEECNTLAKFTSFIVRLMRKYLKIDVQFEYD
ncbi:F-box/LRR-repeat protein [Capsicum baccatum]|uniref:F-box/LRR-repeat protein n=1 Tax=Capsicum baccatum TaxID=33114 RepID=A0A2G2VUU9_CAPBA|nr:F-box/LRR-repeat protein [Capsicum baccatum]